MENVIHVIIESDITRDIGKKIFVGVVSQVAIYFGSKKIIEVIEKAKKNNEANASAAVELG